MMAAACGSEAGPGSVLSNLRIAGSGATALGIVEGRIAARGTLEEVRAQLPGARVVDLQGRTALPSFVDHHVHLLNVGLSRLNAQRDQALYLDLSGLTQEQIGEAVRRRAARTPAGQWILGKGWSQGVWGSASLPDHRLLTEAAPDHPVFLTRVDGHAGWANRLALERAGIGAETEDPAGGRILRFDDGEPAGVLLERANERILALLPELPAATIEEAFRAAAAALAEAGFTQVFDAGFLAPPGVVGLDEDLERIWEILRELDRREPLPVDVALMVPAPSRFAEAILADPGQYRAASPRLRITHLKLFADGAMGSRGAWLSHPFSDDPATRGVARMDAAAIEQWAARALDAGLDVATHAIGDAAVVSALDAYGRLLESRPELDPGRLRVEHFSYASQGDQERAAALGVVLSIQPNFVFPDAAGQTMEDARVGPEASARVYAWGTLSGMGARLAGGSDYFAGLLPPLYTAYAAATRQNDQGRPAGGWHPGERLNRGRALELLTTLHPAGGGPPRHRSLAAGEPADLVILDGDPHALEPARWLDLDAAATLRRGEPTHGTLGR